MWPCGQHRAAEAPRDDALFVAASMELPLVRFFVVVVVVIFCFVLFCFHVRTPLWDHTLYSLTLESFAPDPSTVVDL